VALDAFRGLTIAGMSLVNNPGIGSLVTVPYEGGQASVQRLTYETAFASWLAPQNASLAFAVTFVLLW
jgi:predicted acyltransferase